MEKNKLKFSKLLLMVLLLSVSLVVLQSCLDDDNDYKDQRKIDDELILEYLNSNNINAEKAEEGYYYTMINSNTSGEKVEEDDIVSVYYKMSLLNGKKIDSITEDTGSGKPAKYKITGGSLIPVGLRFGSTKMKEGEKFKFYIPSQLAYADYYYEDIIPSNAIFIIENEIVKIETEEEQIEIEKDSIDNYIADNSIENMDSTSSGLYYKKVSDGDGEKPVDLKTVKIQFVVEYLNGDIIDSTEDGTPFSFKIGSNSVIKGLEEGVKLMEKGEKAILIIPSHLAYDESLQIFPEMVRENLLENKLISEKILPFSILKFEVELIDII